MNDANEFVVICRADAAPDGEPGPYELATRTVFPTRAAADQYATGLAAGRDPLVIRGRWCGLRWDHAARFPEPKLRGCSLSLGAPTKGWPKTGG